MHDIFRADPDEMYIEELAEVARYFKQTDKGVREMSSVIEAIREEGRLEGREEGREEGRTEGERAILADVEREVAEGTLPAVSAMHRLLQEFDGDRGE